MKKQLCFTCINDKFWENGATICWNCFQFKGANNGKKCIVCELDFIWELGSKYCWYCVNNKQILINQHYSRLSNKEIKKIWKN